MKKLNFKSLFINVILALAVGLFVGPSTALGVAGVSALTFAAGTGVQFITGPINLTGVSFMAIQKEIWIEDIKENLFNDSAFIRFGMDHSQYTSFKTVNVPQSGSAPTVVKNRTVAAGGEDANTRTDTILSYNIDSYTTDPFTIRNIEEVQRSYDVRQSHLREHIGVVDERVGDEIAVNWSTDTGARIVRTSGALDGTALAPGATGTRKKLLRADIRALRAILDADKMPKQGRYLILPSAMHDQLFDDNDLINREVMGKETLPEGVFTKLFGFNIIDPRSVVSVYATAGPAVKAVGAATAATDHLAGIAFHSSSVGWSLGAIEPFSSEKDPRYYGDVLSTEVLMGGAKLRTSEKGIAMIVQEA